MALNSFQRTSYRIFGAFTAQHLDQEAISKDLRKARIPVRSEAYMAAAVASALLTFLASLILAAFVAFALLPALGVPASHPLALMGLITAPPLIALTVYAILLTSPKSKANARAKSIDEHLPYALNYIAAMASAGVPIHIIFESLA
ncbi:MAG: hypothetical protein R3185_05690, partial [Candidatus Thermoplasmatota archaeon]|nr:hypothetical protein [Candidatus Thermoplasmatota archaeon]